MPDITEETLVRLEAVVAELDSAAEAHVGSTQSARRLHFAQAAFLSAMSKSADPLIASLRASWAREVEMRKVLRPFADFVTPDPKYMSDDHPVTQGSPMARKQITAGDCRRAAAFLTQPEGEPS